MILRLAALCLAALLVTACQRNDLKEPPVDLGDFALGLNIVVADHAQKVPISREASVEEWEAVMKTAIDDRFGRYEGPKLYNLGVSIDGYALAPPGIPVVAAPKSVIAITANIWDDAAGAKLNEKGEKMTVFESLTGGSIVGSGYTMSKDEQMEALAYNAAKRIEGWLVAHPEWFGLPPLPPKPAPAPGKDK
ncbi:hypothetical protein V6Z72_20185 [Cereibacter sphaeroides]|uniref:hypothetical protein n=1 Tax=Cereibacter sphaeroides TaxID=1063 RepID=UPI00399086FA